LIPCKDASKESNENNNNNNISSGFKCLQAFNPSYFGVMISQNHGITHQ